MKKCEKLALKNGNSITTSNMLIKSQPASLNKEYDGFVILFSNVILTFKIVYSCPVIK